MKYEETITKVRETLKKKKDPLKLKVWFCSKSISGECRHGPFKKEKARNNHEQKKHGYAR